MKIPELCKTCKYATILAYGLRCRKNMKVHYTMGKPSCVKYRMARRFG